MAEGLWREEASFPRLGRAGHAVCAVGDQLLLLGGRINHELCKDVLTYDTVARRWEEVPCAGGYVRSYHSATLVGGEVWVCGGSDATTVVGDVLVYSPTARAFRQPRLRGELSLLHRTAHGACAHPLRPHCLLLFGGYGGTMNSATQEYEYLSDLVEIDTRAGTVQAVEPAGAAPEVRAYLAFVPIGRHCYVVGGRTSHNRLCKGKQLVQVYDCAANRWLTPGMVGGELAPRSSHRAVAVPGGLLVFGGAVDGGRRSADLAFLSVAAGRLAWRPIAPADGPQAAGSTWPLARGAHAADVVGGRLYVCGGYGEDKRYTGDCWSLSLQAAGVQEPAASPVQQQLPPPPQQQQLAAKPATHAAPAASEWRDARRSGRAAAFGSEPQQKRPRQAAGTGRRGAAAVAAVAPVFPAAAPPSPLDSAASGPAHAGYAPQLEQQQQQQQQQQQAGEAVPGSIYQRVRELEQSMREQQALTSTAQQTAAALQAENAGLREQVEHWRKAAMQQQETSRAATEAMLQQTKDELNAARDQLAAAKRDKEEVAARLNADLFKLQTDLQREREQHTDEVSAKNGTINRLNRELMQVKEQAQELREAQGRVQRKLEDEQAARAELDRKLSAARTEHGEQCAALQAAEREAKDAAEALRADKASLEARLKESQAAAADAKRELERQLEQSRQHQESAKREQEDKLTAQREAAALRGRLQQAEAAVTQQRSLAAPIETALKMMAAAVQQLKGDAGGS